MNKGPALSLSEGFTLLEMMVVIFIITLMTGVLIGNMPNFRDKTTLQLVAQDVAITIRGAQVFGIGTRVANSQFSGHGIYFCTPNTEGCRKNFVLFNDEDNNKFFNNSEDFGPSSDAAGGGDQTSDAAAWRSACDPDENSGTECAEAYNLGGNIEVCAITINDDISNTTNQVSVSFSRLYPDAFIVNSEGDADGGVFANNVQLYLHSTRDKKSERKITIYNTGGITVTNVPNEELLCNN